MDAITPKPIGQSFVVKELRPLIFVGIEGAAIVRPKGYIFVSLAGLLGWLGPLLTVYATDPLAATHLYIAVTPDDFRIFSKPRLSSPFEIGRWKKGCYRASIPDGGPSVRPVFDLAVQGASGPVIQP